MIEDKFPYYAGGRSGLPGRAPVVVEVWNDLGTGGDGQRGKTPNVAIRADVNNQFHGYHNATGVGRFLLPGPSGFRPHFYGYVGLMGTPHLARAQITTVPAVAAVTLASTLTIPAGSIGVARVFEFNTVLTIGDVLVDLTGLVTSSELALALAIAIASDIANAKCAARPTPINPATSPDGQVSLIKLNFGDPGSENNVLVFSDIADGWAFDGFGGTAGTGYLTGATDPVSGGASVEGNVCTVPVHIGPNCWAVPCPEGELDQFDPPDPE